MLQLTRILLIEDEYNIMQPLMGHMQRDTDFERFLGTGMYTAIIFQIASSYIGKLTPDQISRIII